MAIIAPSLLSADFLHLERDCDMLNQSKADWFHLDVMDGQFVPNISFGPMIVAAICKSTTKYCDVHLMIEEPEKYTAAFKNAGANNITVHVETCKYLHNNIQQIKDLGMDPGVAINPDTPIESLKNILKEVSLVCLMSVHPGFGGQSFIPSTINKIKELRAMINEQKLDTKIEVDGGVTLENAASIINAGADILVAGNTIFKSIDPIATIEALKSI